MRRPALTALFIGALPLCLFPILLLAGTSQNDNKPKAARSAQNEGERVFALNCSRCHMPPMSIPPRATGTILAHMRTRARLSRADEQALLKFMAP